MTLLTAVEHYVIAALDRAIPEPQADGSVAAWIPEFPGVIAYGADTHACARALSERLEEWIRRALSSGFDLPVLNGIDLTEDAERILASYSPADSVGGTSQFFLDEEELEAAFARWESDD